MAKDHRMRIGNIDVGRGYPPIVIAEMSANHNQSLERALQIVDAAHKAGAHAVKLQTYTADTLTIDCDDSDFFISDPDSQWSGQSLYQLYRKAEMPWEWHRPIFDRCRDLGLICFSSVFDESAVDFLEGLDVPAYKIASFENIDLPLIKKTASTGKPVIISTGMATVEEIGEIVETAKTAGCTQLILLKCTSTYPAPAKDSNLATIPEMEERFDVPIGLSDHTLGIGVAIASVAMGAVAIEKHFTLNRADGGVDADFSLEPDELRNLVIEAKRAFDAIGDIRFGPVGSETGSLKFRRSIYVVADVGQGDELDSRNLKIIRPGFGLAPKHYDSLIGRCARKDIKKGTPMSWELLR